MPLEVQARFLNDLEATVIYLHSLHVVHNDLKPIMQCSQLAKELSLVTLMPAYP